MLLYERIKASARQMTPFAHRGWHKGHNPQWEGAEGVCLCVYKRESSQWECVHVRAASQIQSHNTTLIQIQGGWRDGLKEGMGR